nr:unnamed protein product [Haemonchus contortus]
MKFRPQNFRATFVSLLILFQVDRMLFCTFTQFIPAQEYYWRNINRSMIKNSSSIGGCMKMCVESPDCVSISVVKEGEIVSFCFPE